MSVTYRHITNLRTPFDRHDWTLLHIMDDWRLGDPVQAKPSETEIPPVPVQTMKAGGIVGVYAPLSTIQTRPFLTFTGWKVDEAWWQAQPELV